jgi:hypothetical protein
MTNDEAANDEFQMTNLLTIDRPRESFVIRALEFIGHSVIGHWSFLPPDSCLLTPDS